MKENGNKIKGWKQKHIIREPHDMDRLIAQAITKGVLTGEWEKPSFTIEEWNALCMKVAELLLLDRGATPEELEAVRKEGEAQVLEMIAEHEKRLQNFGVLDGGKE